MKWTQWDGEFGMIRCGFKDQKTLMQWMRELGAEAKKCLAAQDKPHAVYGRKIYDNDGNLEEIRFYCNTYMDDKELEGASRSCPRDVIYAAHK